MSLQRMPRGISSAQLTLLLLVSRLFTIFTFAPREGQAIPGSTLLFSMLLGAVASLLAILPMLWLQKRAGGDLLLAAAAIGKGYGWLAALLSGGFCLALGGFTISHFEFFMTSAVYPGSPPWVFLIGLTVAAGYAARLGLEAFARLGVFLFGICALLCLFIFCMLIPQMQLVYLESPFAAGPQMIWRGAAQAVLGNVEIFAFLLLFARTKKPSAKPYFIYLLLGLLFFELLSFAVLTALGDYAGTRLFPLFTAATAARPSVFGRLDLLHIAMWVFLAFMRATLFLYCGMVCLRRIFPKLSMPMSACICGTLAGGFSIWAAGGPTHLKWAGELLYGPWTFALLVLLLPLLTALLTKPKTKRKEEAT